MTEWINEYYFWIKWVHYLAFVSWMAGLFLFASFVCISCRK